MASSRSTVFQTTGKNIATAEIQNSIFTIQECSIDERGNRNEIVLKLEETIEYSMKVTVILLFNNLLLIQYYYLNNINYFSLWNTSFLTVE